MYINIFVLSFNTILAFKLQSPIFIYKNTIKKISIDPTLVLKNQVKNVFKLITSKQKYNLITKIIIRVY